MICSRFYMRSVHYMVNIVSDGLRFGEVYNPGFRIAR